MKQLLNKIKAIQNPGAVIGIASWGCGLVAITLGHAVQAIYFMLNSSLCIGIEILVVLLRNKQVADTNSRAQIIAKRANND